jgi:hypothetical protein
MGSDLEGSAEKCRIVATRANGERVVISNHDSLQIAQRTLRLIRHGPDFRSVEIEPSGPDEAARS